MTERRRNVEQIENDVQAAIEIRTGSGSIYQLSAPDPDGFRDITKVPEIGRSVHFRGKIHGIATANPLKKVGNVLEDGRWVVPTEAIKIGDAVVILRDDQQFASTTQIAFLFIEE